MEVKHTFTVKGWNGIYDVGIQIVDKVTKEYTYHIQLEKTIQKFLYYLKRKWYGKAINLLKENNIKPEGI